MSDEPEWPAHWADPETMKYQLMEQEFTEREAADIIEGFRYILAGLEGVTLYPKEPDE